MVLHAGHAIWPAVAQLRQARACRWPALMLRPCGDAAAVLPACCHPIFRLQVAAGHLAVPAGSCPLSLRFFQLLLPSTAAF